MIHNNKPFNNNSSNLNCRNPDVTCLVFSEEPLQESVHFGNEKQVKRLKSNVTSFYVLTINVVTSRFMPVIIYMLNLYEGICPNTVNVTYFLNTFCTPVKAHDWVVFKMKCGMKLYFQHGPLSEAPSITNR